ncbi:M56 family metallopeptidase [Mucilaginibacter flavidus]|uniref:M56 family metallopeptidase n=1 Tax=Mucilaginibacter flavidus TaxID=2949309 RepID=UPI0020931D17|nr:M56 family metallopeptidase [Mucilaginibacter flavidus]MCO5948295.1 M56 family metallopeptidase [Mucilaginibacter flavidus]
MEQRIQHLFPPRISQAICHALMHSLWQGILLAILTGIIVLFTRKANAAIRYRLLTGTLLLFTIVFVYTLAFELLNRVESNFNINKASVSAKTNALTDVWSNLGFGMKYAHEQEGIIVAIWLMVVMLQCARLLFGLYITKRLKRVKINRVPIFWSQKLLELSSSLKIKQTVTLLESGIAKIPLVIGYLKPVILIPVGLVNSMEQPEVEAILLHELAHIGRNDYLVNLLQSIMETLLFFNPAVLWLSHLIKTERENCCDDVVLAQTGNKINYIRALVHFQEYNFNPPRHTFALGGNGTAIIARMERMINNRNRGLNYFEIICLAILLAFGVLFISAGPVNNIRSLINTKQTALPQNAVNAKALEAKKQAEKAAAERTRKPGTSP